MKEVPEIMIFPMEKDYALPFPLEKVRLGVPPSSEFHREILFLS